MPDVRRRSRPLSRHVDVYTEPDGLFGRLADLVIENPVRSGGFAAMALISGAIITNAAYFQTAHHPDPFFVTRSDGQAAAPAHPEAKTVAPPASETPPAAAPGAASEATPPMPPLPTAEQRAMQDAPATATDTSAVDRQSSAVAVPVPARPRAKPSVASAAKTVATARNATAAAPAPAVPAGALGLIADTQRALLDSRLYDGPVDGILGPQTKSAISSFEMKIGLIPTGQPSPRLLQQIRRGYPAAIEPQSTGSVGNSRLKRVQKALNEIGYGPIPEDGVDGEKTAAAIRHFEADNRLPQTGRVSDALAAKLVMIGAMPHG